MSETIDLQPVIAKLSDSSDKQKEQTLRKELLELQVNLTNAEAEEKEKTIGDIKSKLDAFELTISSENKITPELQASIDKAQEEIVALEAQQAAEEKAATDETAGETKSLREKLTTSSDPEKEFTGWWKKIGTSILGFLGIGTALTSVASKAGGGEKTESTKGLFDKAKEWVMGIFGLGEEKPTVTPDVTTESSDIGSEKHKALVEEIKKLNIDFKDPTPDTADVNETKDRLALLSTKALTMMKSVGEKYPGVRITSTLRSRIENGKLENSAENSKHMYGFAFDIGRDTRVPAQYAFTDVQTYITANYPSSKTLIHGTGTDEHLHIETDESTDGKSIFETDEDIKTKLTPPALVAAA